MSELRRIEMERISAGVGWTTCGVTLGVSIAATMLYGVTGFLLTVNKTLVACTLAAATSPRVGLARFR